jgi:iron only hydrogenase large subunit-like protein
MTATSCCPAWVNYGKKVNKKFEDNISHTPSPMIKAGEAKKNNEKFVFIGPCISKKKEAEKTEIDFVLTYEELACMLAAKSIDVLSLEETNFDLEGNNKGRIFAQSGGVAEAVQSYLTDKLNVEKINGITKQTKKLFYTIDKEKIDLLEVMSCERGCIGGPCVITNPLVTSKMLEKYIKQNIQ